MTAVAALPHIARFTLDRDWMVVAFSAAAAPWMTAALGRNVWEAFPNSEGIFRPLYERAWKTGYSRGYVFFHGQLLDLEAYKTGLRLVVSFESAGQADWSTTQALAASLDRMTDLVRSVQAAPGSADRPSLGGHLVVL